MIRQKMDSLSFELLSRMAHMMTRMTRMTHWLDSNDSLASSLSRPPVYLSRQDQTVGKKCQ